MRKFNDYVKQNRKRQGNVRKTVSGKYKICKKDNGKHRVFGYAIIGNGEKEIESQLGYSVSVKDLELAIYEFIRNMPTNDMSNPVRIIESCVFTKEKQQAIGIPIGILDRTRNLRQINLGNDKDQRVPGIRNRDRRLYGTRVKSIH